MNKYLKKEVITPIIVILIFVLYIVEALKLSAPIVDGIPQETFFPLIIFVIGFIAAASLLFSAVKKASTCTEVKEKKAFNYKPILIMVATAILILLFDVLGYSIVAPIYVFTMMMIYDDKPQHIVKKIIFSIIVALFIYALYTYVFGINFPQIWR